MENEWLESIKDLKASYRKTVRMLRKAYEEAGDPTEKELIADMISDCIFAIEWMHTGRRPGSKRGIERRAAYQREYLMDPLVMQSMFRNSSGSSPTSLTDFQRYQIEDALCRLTQRERECYELKHGQCFTYGEIANLLGLSKGSVQEYVERAQKKVSHDLQDSLFLVI